MRRDASRERLFFLLVLVGALLLLSGLMLRHDSAALSTRTFRDGFTVAEDVVRPPEAVATSNAVDRNATKAPSAEHEEDSGAADVRMTTITTENGDEITIKRAATSKGSKVTTISRDETGKLTIEDAAAEKADEEQARAEAESAREAHEEVGRGMPDDSVTASPTIERHNATDTTRREEERTGENGEMRIEEEEDKGDDKAVITRGGKKVTVVQVDRFLTKVSFSDVDTSGKKEITR